MIADKKNSNMLYFALKRSASAANVVLDMLCRIINKEEYFIPLIDIYGLL